MSVKIITDSASDITQEEAKKLGITVLPLTIFFETEEFQDNVTLSTTEYYNKLIESAELPKTSQVTPYAFSKAYKDAFNEHDEIVVITISKYLSGCFQSATLAKEEFDDNKNIYLIDSLNATIGEQVLVKLAVKLRDEGKSGAEIASILEEKVSKVRLIALLDTLEYLKKGGRISSATAFFGGLLSIKPVIGIDNGQVKMIGKARGSKNANNLLKELVVQNGGIDFELPFSLAYSGLNDTLLQKYISDNKDLYEKYVDSNTLGITHIGCTIGTHVGPGAIAVAFFSKE